MVDQILKTLLQQRLMAAKEFLGFCPVGSYYDYNGQICIVTGYDPKTGFLNLQPTGSSSGAFVHPDPISIMFPNAVPNPTPSIAAALPKTSPLAVLGSAAPAALSGLPALAAWKSKGAKAATGGANQPQYLPDGSFNPNYNGGGITILSPDAALKNLQQAQQTYNQVNSAVIQETQFNGIDLQSKIAANFGNDLQGVTAQMNSVDTQIANLMPANGNLSSLSQTDLDRFDSLLQQSNDLHAQYNQDFLNSTNLQSPDVVAKMQQILGNDSTALGNAYSNLQTAQYQYTLSTSYQAINSQISAQAGDAFNALPSQQRTDLLYGAESQLKSAGNKTPSFNDIQSLAEKNFATNLQLSPQDLASLKDIAIQNAIDNNPGVDPKTLTMDNPLVQKEMTDLVDPANLSDPNNDLSIFMAKKQNALLQASQDKYNAALRNEEIQAGAELAGAAYAGYKEESAISSMFANGFSGKDFAVALTSAFGMFIALHLVNNILMQSVSPLADKLSSLMLLGHNIGAPLEKGLEFLTSGWGFLAIQGFVILMAWLLGKKKSPEQQAAETLNAEVNPMVWNPNGQVIFLTAGLTLATMGLNLSPSAPMMQTLTLTQAQATLALTNAGAGSVPTDSTRYADVFVQQGAKGQPTRVVWLTPTGTDSKGNVIEKVTVQTLNQNFQFATSQPPTGYVPFFINGPGGKPIPNPQVVQSLSNQQHLLLCADGTWVTDASKCAAAAGTASHSGGS